MTNNRNFTNNEHRIFTYNAHRIFTYKIKEGMEKNVRFFSGNKLVNCKGGGGLFLKMPGLTPNDVLVKNTHRSTYQMKQAQAKYAMDLLCRTF